MDRGMQFENTMRLLFGEKAYQIAGTEANRSIAGSGFKKPCENCYG